MSVGLHFSSCRAWEKPICSAPFSRVLPGFAATKPFRIPSTRGYASFDSSLFKFLFMIINVRVMFLILCCCYNASVFYFLNLIEWNLLCIWFLCLDMFIQESNYLPLLLLVCVEHLEDYVECFLTNIHFTVSQNTFAPLSFFF